MGAPSATRVTDVWHPTTASLLRWGWFASAASASYQMVVHAIHCRMKPMVKTLPTWTAVWGDCSTFNDLCFGGEDFCDEGDDICLAPLTTTTTTATTTTTTTTTTTVVEETTTAA